MSVEERLRRVEAKLAIQELIARYAHGADRKNDPAIMGPLFAENGCWSAVGFAALEGREAVAAGLADLARTHVLWSIHYMVSPHIVLGDDLLTARCHWYLWELSTMQTPNGPEDHWFGGCYESELVCVNGEWLFSKVLLDVRVEGQAIPPWAHKKGFEA